MDDKEIISICNKLALPNFDLLIIGDGSGTVSMKPCAWSGFTYDPYTKEIVKHFGTVTFGTNNFAELLPYFNILWLDSYNRNCSAGRRVEIISDSEITVKCGNREYSKGCNQMLWAGIDWLETVGYTIHWNHVPRNSNSLLKECDRLASKVRKITSVLLDSEREEGYDNSVREKALAETEC